MKIWVIAIGEPLPLKSNKDRLHRCGLLNNILVKRNHDVTWWSSTFNHFTKKHIYHNQTKVQLQNNYKLELLHGCTYLKNISFSRIKNHWQISKQFNKSIINYEKPDLIFVGFPSIELAYNASQFAIENKIPIVIDARDMWPDIFLSVVPRYAIPAVKILLQSYFRMTKYIFSNATAIIGITDGFVDWGLKYSNRSKTVNDKSFYLAYSNDEIETVFDKPNNFWKDFGINKNDFIITYIGAITKNKIDLEPIFKAAKYLINKYPVKFVIAGDGDGKNYFENKAIELKLNNIYFPGWINKYQIKSLLYLSSLGLVPIKNRFDYILSIPNKPIEYLAHKLPIISSLDGELRKLILENNIGFHYANSHELISIIEDLTKNKLKIKKIKTNCSKVFNDKFDSNKIYSRLESYLVKLTKDKKNY